MKQGSAMRNIEISYQNYDIAFEEIFSIFQDQALDFLGISLPKITHVLDSAMPEIVAREQRFDLVFELEDGTILHLEEADVSMEDVLRFASYDLRIYSRYRKKVHTVVLNLQKFREKIARFDAGTLRYQLAVCSLKEQDGDRRLEEIRERIKKGEPVNAVELAFVPLMASEKDAGERIKIAVKTALELKEIDSETKKKLVFLIMVMSDKLVERKILEEIWEEIKVYKVIQFAEEKGMEKGMKKGMEKGRMQTLVMQLTKKFKGLPQNYVDAIYCLDTPRLDVMLNNIFDFQKLSDLDPYLGFSRREQ